MPCLSYIHIRKLKKKIMKKILSLSLAIAVLAFSASAQVQRQGKFGQKGQMGQMHKGEGVKAMAKDLDLTDTQKQEMKKIHQDTQSKLEALRADKTITVGEMESRRKAILDEQKAKMDALLTTEQKAKIEQRKTEMKEKAGQMQEKRQEKMKEELGLSNDQAAKLKALNEKARNQVQAIKNDSKLTQEEKMAKLKALKETTDAERKTILTAEQNAKFETLRAERKDKIKEMGPRKGGMKKEMKAENL